MHAFVSEGNSGVAFVSSLTSEDQTVTIDLADVYAAGQVTVRIIELHDDAVPDGWYKDDYDGLEPWQEPDLAGQITTLDDPEGTEIAVELNAYEVAVIEYTTYDTISEVAGTHHHKVSTMDYVRGSDGGDQIWSGGGNDYIDAGAGNDLLYGGTGDDHLFGGKGDDEIWGGMNHDYIEGGFGDDTINGENGKDVIYGGGGADTVTGGTGKDKVYLGNNSDVFYDNNQSDGNGRDAIYGGNGDDTIYAGGGNDLLSGGNGNDVFIFELLAASDTNDGAITKIGKDTISNLEGGDSIQIDADLLIDATLSVAEFVDTGVTAADGDFVLSLVDGQEIQIRDFDGITVDDLDTMISFV